MTTRVLVINSGSSSLKYQVVDAVDGDVLAAGLVERIGAAGGVVTHEVQGEKHVLDCVVPDHEAAMTAMAAAFSEHGPQLHEVGLIAVGHRVVQGGEEYGEPVVIDDDVVRVVNELVDLAPLHNPANLAGIRVARAEFPDLPHVAVFDTAFHRTMPARAYTYAIDAEVAREHRVRRYGFHGTSHAYVSREAARLLGRPAGETNVIVLHLGNGASATAVRGGESIDTSMGMTPLEGLVMGTRSGDVDPAIVFHLARTAGMDIDELDDLLNKRSGVLGLSGRQDMRDLVAAAESGDADAGLALDVYCYRLRKYVGAYTAALGRVDAVVFTAGVGENSAPVRARALADLEVLGIELDPAANAAVSRVARDIASPASRVRVLVVPTNEELEIARQAAEVVSG
ncbi:MULTISPECIES: acetate/propionate family kinase [unclassified Nocardioides]|uniref:acetate/propionate family kinase n=1 Tax=unclassified Nocardioides TaxID=2615069 RepID=UPI0006FE503D|nr:MULTISPECIES: acetate kinase [unclassified Nocardioides]KRA29661.1 acetate kinase [Nocardioides sp. Root614]KRA88164.1 acetate kinase [Nocardioides sp. Root682]